MKKRCGAILAALLLMLAAKTVPAMAAEEDIGVISRQGCCCKTDWGTMDRGYQALLERKAEEKGQRGNEESLSNMPGNYIHAGLMPSTGKVNMLVLPIAFADYPEQKENFAPQELYEIGRAHV